MQKNNFTPLTKEHLRRFISIEGCDGAGKTRLAHNIKTLLLQKQLDAFITHEPGGTPLACRIRQLFKHKAPSDTSSAERLTQEADALLVSAARAQHVRYAIIPALLSAKIVVSDRFVDSTRVYQGYVGQLPTEFIETLISHSTYGCLPSLTFLLDASPKFLCKRRKERQESSTASQTSSVERFDDAALSFHQKIREGYLALEQKDTQRFCIIDAHKPADDIAQQVMEVMQKHLAI
ncbi:MAG: dTMP kinase [Proteobacteria bacterium]|nr:dTMP kinase [Pseudomonadota bacterium]